MNQSLKRAYTALALALLVPPLAVASECDVVVKFKTTLYPKDLSRDSLNLMVLQKTLGFQRIPLSQHRFLKSLSSLYRLQFAALPFVSWTQVCNRLKVLDWVDYCDVVPRRVPPPAVLGVDSGAPLASWRTEQGYLNAAPQGIDAYYAWGLGVYGSGVAVHDAEWAWNQDHEEFDPARLKIGLLESAEDYADHGTAVLGVMMAGDNGFGMTGALPGVDSVLTYSELSDGGRVGAIVSALEKAKRGDILTLEMQTPACHASGDASQYGPADYNASVWDLVKAATDSGIVVIAAAGNGKQNLDDACFGDYHARGDNGSIIVGAGKSADRSPASFSSYGTRVDLQAWGDWSVYSTGYGNLYNGGSNSTYTSNFSGTSAAVPIVASAAALVQSWAKKALGRPLEPREIRSLLVETGTPQAQDSRHIGPLPNVKAALESLAKTHGLSSTSLGNIGEQTFVKDSKDRWVYSGDAYHLNLSYVGEFRWKIVDLQGRVWRQGQALNQGSWSWSEALPLGAYYLVLESNLGLVQRLWLP